MATVTAQATQPLKSSSQAIEDLYRQAKDRLDSLCQDIKAEIKKELRVSGDRAVAKVRRILLEVQ